MFIRLIVIISLAVALFSGVHYVLEGRHFYIQALGYVFSIGVFSWLCNVVRSYVVKYPDPDEYLSR